MPVYRNDALLRLCNAGMICVAIGPNLVPVYLTSFSDALGGLGEAQLGSLGGLLFTGFVLGILISGPLADFLGAKPFALAGTALSAFGLVLLADAFDYGSLLLASFIIGLGAGLIDMAMSPIVSTLAHTDRAAALNRLHAFYCIGAVGTIAIASLLVYLDVSWRFVVIASAIVPACVFVGFGLEPVPPLVREGKKRQRIRHLVRAPAFYLGLVGIALAGATEEGMVQWLPAYAERALGFSKSTAALGLGGFAVAMGLGRWIAGRHLGFLAPQVLVGGGAALCAVGFLAGALIPVPAVALVACALVGLGCSVLWPTLLALAADNFPHGGATLFAAMAAAGNAGCLLAPLLYGYIADFNGLHVALGVGALYPLLLVGWVVLAARKG